MIKLWTFDIPDKHSYESTRGQVHKNRVPVQSLGLPGDQSASICRGRVGVS